MQTRMPSASLMVMHFCNCLVKCMHVNPCVSYFLSADGVTDSGVDQSEVVSELLKELSNHSERVEERKAALCELMRLIRETQLHVWDEHFKTILLLLLETLGDGEVIANIHSLL